MPKNHAALSGAFSCWPFPIKSFTTLVGTAGMFVAPIIFIGAGVLDERC
jgi:hypothetical protein